MNIIPLPMSIRNAYVTSVISFNSKSLKSKYTQPKLENIV